MQTLAIGDTSNVPSVHLISARGFQLRSTQATSIRSSRSRFDTNASPRYGAVEIGGMTGEVLTS